MRPLSLTYPHDPQTFEPARMPAWLIWQLAGAARAQLCLRPKTLRLDIAALAGRSRAVDINGVTFSLAWEMDGPVADDSGAAVFGATEVLRRSSRHATIQLNAELIGDRSDLALSTALHELGHIVFDVPGWIGLAAHDGEGEGGDDGATPLRFLRLDRSDTSTGTPDWPEWRANEFMGGFLVPRPLLAKALGKCARQLRLPMIEADVQNAPPQVVIDRFSGRFDDLVQSLADGFGLSASFIATRLIKYRMIAGGR